MIMNVGGTINMIEVKGTDERGFPQIISFDGRVLEIFSYLAGSGNSRRFHVEHIEKIEIQEKDDKPPILDIELKFPASFALYKFKEGGENLQELVDDVKQAMDSLF